MYPGPATNRTIYIRAVVDAASALQNRADPPIEAEAAAVSLDPAQVIVTTTAGAVDQGTGAVTFDAAPADIVRFYATSGSNNFEDAVLIKDVRSAADDEVLEGFELVQLSQTVIAPTAQSAEQTQEPVKQDFWFWQGPVAGEGSQGCRLVLALYDRDEEGQPRFAGLYRWDLQLTVQSSPPPPEANPQNPEEQSS